MEQKVFDSIGKDNCKKSFCLIKIKPFIFFSFFSLSPGILILENIEGMFFKFIWNGKLDKIKWKTLTKKYLDGGLNMLNYKILPQLLNNLVMPP